MGRYPHNPLLDPAGCTVPPQMAPRKRPGPKPGSRRKQSTPKPAAARKEAPKEAGDKHSEPSPVEPVKAVVESLGSGLAGLNVFMKNWMGVLTNRMESFLPIRCSP